MTKTRIPRKMKLKLFGRKPNNKDYKNSLRIRQYYIKMCRILISNEE